MTPAELVTLIEGIALPGYSPEEVRFMGNTVAVSRPEVVFDWGTNRGSSARIWLEATEGFKVRPPIHTVDLGDELSGVTQDHAGIFTGMYVWNLRRVQQHRGDGVEVALRLYEECGSPERALFFVDGDHSAEAVEAEVLRLAEEAPSATLLLHDTNHPNIADLTGPRQAVDSLLRTSGRYAMLELKSDAGIIRLWPKEAT